MRSEEKENFRLVSPITIVVMCDYADFLFLLRERSRIDPLQVRLCGHCASNAQQLEVEGWAKLQRINCGGSVAWVEDIE